MSHRDDEIKKFKEVFLSFNIDSVGDEAKNLLKGGILAKDVLEICQQCMEEIGKKFEVGDYYLPELVISGEMFQQISSILRPHLKTDEVISRGKLVIGTPQGDIHSLGKDIFGTLAEASGFDVFDLGVDVPPEAFVKKLGETKASILGMSALLTTTYTSIQDVIRLLEENGIRRQTLVILGGGATTRDMPERLGADAQTRDAYEGLQIVQSFVDTHEVNI